MQTAGFEHAISTIERPQILRLRPHGHRDRQKKNFSVLFEEADNCKSLTIESAADKLINK